MNFEEAEQEPLVITGLPRKATRILTRAPALLFQVNQLTNEEIVSVLRANNQRVNPRFKKTRLALVLFGLLSRRGAVAVGPEPPEEEEVEEEFFNGSAPSEPPAATPAPPAAPAHPSSPDAPAKEKQQDEVKREMPSCMVCWCRDTKFIFSLCGHLGVCEACRDGLFPTRDDLLQIVLRPPVEDWMFMPAPCPICRHEHTRDQVRPVFLPW